MAVLIGAIAYRTSVGNQVKRQIRSWGITTEHGPRQQTKCVYCPRCSESYTLIEGVDATDELLQEDAEFLEKALSAVHPYYHHPAHMFVRDPAGMLNRCLNINPAAMASNSGRKLEGVSYAAAESQNDSTPDHYQTLLAHG